MASTAPPEDADGGWVDVTYDAAAACQPDALEHWYSQAAPEGPITVSLNGRAHSFVPDPRQSLLDWVRSTGATGQKKSCNQGGCGACVLMLTDGETHMTAAVNGCLRLIAMCDGAVITTTEVRRLTLLRTLTLLLTLLPTLLLTLALVVIALLLLLLLTLSLLPALGCHGEAAGSRGGQLRSTMTDRD